MSFRSFLKRLGGPLRAVPVRLMGRLVGVFRRAPKRGAASRTRPFTATDGGRLSNSAVGERKDRPAVDPALAEAETDVPELAAAPRHDEDEPGEAQASREDSRSDRPPNREELGQDEAPETTVASSEPASTMSRDDEDGNHEALAGEGSNAVDPLPDGPGTAAGEHGADLAEAREATDTAPQEEDGSSDGQAGSDDGLGGPASGGGETGQAELNEATREKQPTGSEPASIASPDIEDRDGQPGRNNDSSHAPAPLPHEPGSPDGEGRSAEPEPKVEGMVDETHADAAATGGGLPDAPTGGPDDLAGPAPAEPGPPTTSPPRVTTEGPRRAREPWRSGARRMKRDSALEDRDSADCALPELRIRDAGGRWELLLSVDPKAAGQSEVSQDGDPLPLVRDGAWRVRDFRREIVVTEDADATRIPLYTGREPLVFRLLGAGGEGTQRRRMTDRGQYVVVAQAGKLRRGAGAVFREPEPCDDHRFLAHFFDFSAGREAETAESFPEWNYGATAGSASLAGRSLLDSSEDGELFVGDAPTLVSTDGIEWARIGEEQEGGWKGRNFLVAGKTPGDVLNGACGRFFLRTYRTGETHLDDSRSFRYWPDLARIEVNGQDFDPERILIPGRNGHRKATVRLVGRAGHSLSPDSVHPPPPRASVSRDGTISVSPRAADDEVRIGLRRDRWRMDVVVALPRVWWRLGSRNDWIDTPISLSRREFRRIENQRLEIRVPDSVSSVRARFGNQGDDPLFRAMRTGASAHRCCDVPLANFADLPALRHKNLREDATILIQVAGREVEVIRVRPEPSRQNPPSPPPLPPSPRVAISTEKGTGAAVFAEADDQGEEAAVSRDSGQPLADAPGARSDGTPFEDGDLVFYPQIGHCDVGAVISDEQTGLHLLELTPRESGVADAAATRILVPVDQLENRGIRRTGASPGVIAKILGSEFEPRVEDAAERLDLIAAQEREGTVASLALALKRLHLRRETKVITQEEEKRRVRIRKWLVAEYMAEEEGRTGGQAQSAITGLLSRAMKAVRAREEAEAIERKRRERAKRVEAARKKRALRKKTALGKRAECT